MGLAGQGGGNVLGGFATPSGSLTRSFGTIRWSSSGMAQTVPTLAAASSAAGFRVPLPSRLPAGVGRPRQFVVQPRVKVTVDVRAGVPTIGGSSVVLDAGPAVLVAYGSSGGLDVPTLGILTMPRPTAVATGAALRQIEAFVLDQPGVPADLAQEIRLLGDVGTTLPVPVPARAIERSVDVAGSPGVLVTDSSNIATGRRLGGRRRGPPRRRRPDRPEGRPRCRFPDRLSPIRQPRRRDSAARRRTPAPAPGRPRRRRRFMRSASRRATAPSSR